METTTGEDTMNVIELLCSGIFIIGLGVFLGMILALFAITFETMYDFFENKLFRFKKRIKK